MKKIQTAALALLAMTGLVLGASGGGGLSTLVNTNFENTDFIVDLTAAPTNRVHLNISDDFTHGPLRIGTNIKTSALYWTNIGGILQPTVGTGVLVTNFDARGNTVLWGTLTLAKKSELLSLGTNVLGSDVSSMFYCISPTNDPAQVTVAFKDGYFPGQLLLLVNYTNAVPSDGAFTVYANSLVSGGGHVIQPEDWRATNTFSALYTWQAPDWVMIDAFAANGQSVWQTNVFQSITILSNINLKGNATFNYITINGTNVSTINPTDLYVPYRTGTNSFGDSLFYRPNNYTMMLEGLDSSVSKQASLTLTNTSDPGAHTFLSQDVNAGAFGTTKPEITISIPNYVVYLVPGQFRPDSSNHIDLGVPIVPWAQVYANGYNWYGTNDNTGNYSGATATFDMTSGLLFNSIAAGTGGSPLGFTFTGAPVRQTTTYMGTAQVTNNIAAVLAVGDATYVDVTKASQTNAVSGTVTISFATNGIAGQDLTHVRWFFNGSGSDQTITIPSGWRTNLVSAVPAKLTNAVITVMYVKCGGPTASAATQTNCYVSFEYYK